MSKTAPRARSRATWLGVVLMSALTLGQLGILSANADTPPVPPEATEPVADVTVAPETVLDETVPQESAEEGKIEADPVDPIEAVAGTVDPTDPVDPEPGEAGFADASGASDEAATLAAEATPSIVTSLPDLEVTKTSNALGVLHRGDRFTYTITVANAGTDKAIGVQIHDELPAGLDVLVPPLPSFQGKYCTVASSVVPPGIPFTTVDCGPAPLDGGASTTVEIDVHVNGDTCGTIANVVVVSGSNEPAGNVGAENRAEATDELACVPRIRLDTSGPSLAHVGDEVRYAFTVTNTGAVDLHALELGDPVCDRDATPTSRGDGDAILSPGERWSYSCSHRITAADGDDVHDVATVRAAHEGAVAADTDAHDVDVIHPDIAIVSTATPASGAAGTSISYTFTVTNTGDTALRHVSVDDVHGHVGSIRSLGPGRTVELTASGSLGSSPVTNVGTAEGTDALGRSVLASDGVTVSVVSAGGAGGTPFTGADTNRLTTTIAILTLSGVGLIVATGRRRRTA